MTAAEPTIELADGRHVPAVSLRGRDVTLAGGAPARITEDGNGGLWIHVYAPRPRVVVGLDAPPSGNRAERRAGARRR